MTSEEVRAIQPGDTMKRYHPNLARTRFRVRKVRERGPRDPQIPGAWAIVEGEDGCIRVIESDEYLRCMGHSTHEEIQAMGMKTTKRIEGAEKISR